MQLAAQRNGLEEPGIHPWFIHATWQIAASPNHPAIQGVFEEWWTGPGDYKVVYSSPNFRRTVSVTTSGRSATGDAQWPDAALAMIDPLLRMPIPSLAQIGSMQFTNQRTTVQKHRLRCAQVVSTTEPRPSLAKVNLWFVSDYCFDGDLPAIRMEAAPNFWVIFNSIVQFQGRYLADSVQILRAGLPEVDIHVDDVHTIESNLSSTSREKLP